VYTGMTLVLVGGTGKNTPIFAIGFEFPGYRKTSFRTGLILFSRIEQLKVDQGLRGAICH